MKNIVAFVASNSKKSINKELITYVSRQINTAEITTLDLNDFELPIYSPDLQDEKGIPANSIRFNEIIASCDGIVLSLAEHNGSYSAAFKNLWDWTSRFNKVFWANKPVLLMSASPGARGGENVLKIAIGMFPYFGGNIITSFSLPSFYENFAQGAMLNPALSERLKQKILLFQNAI